MKEVSDDIVDELYNLAVEILEETDNLEEASKLEDLMNELDTANEPNNFKVRSIVSHLVDTTKHFKAKV